MSLDVYYNIAKFISQILGPSYSVSLFDFNSQGDEALLVYSSEDSRPVSLTGKYIQKLSPNLNSSKEPFLHDVLCSDSADERTSIFFLFDENNSPSGAISVTYNIGERNNLISALQAMLNIAPLKHENMQLERATKDASPIPKTFTPEMLPMHVASILREYGIEPGQVQLSADEKFQIINTLNERGVFLLKNSVVEVAEQLNSSEATIYRYLSKLNRKASDDNWEPIRLI